MPKRHALLIVNPGSGNSDYNRDETISYLATANIQTTAYELEGNIDINTLLDQHVSENQTDLVIIGGGDGTLNGAAGGIIKHRLPLGILPMGTANDLARTLGIPSNLQSALDIIIQDKRSKIDIGRVNGIFFFNASSIGMGVDVTRSLSSDVKSKWGVLSYARAAWDTFSSNRSFNATIVHDGNSKRFRSIQITIGNGRFYGGGMIIEENATIDDHRLDLYSIKPQSIWKLIMLAPIVRLGWFKKHNETDYLQSKVIEVYTRRPRSVTTDGEVSTQTPAHFSVLPDAMTVFTP